MSEEPNVTEETIAEAVAAQAPAAAAAEGEASSLAAQLAEAEARAAEYLEGWQRERAELANYRKRVERERTEIYQNARVDVTTRFLPVLDDFERALNAIPEDARPHEWVNGVTLIYRKLQSILEAEGIVAIDALGKPFDPNLHEAISQDENDSFESDHVIEVLQKGYRYGDRVLRPALVRVAR